MATGFCPRNLAQIRSPQRLQLAPPNSWATTDFLRKSDPDKVFPLQGTFFLRNSPDTNASCGVFSRNRNGISGFYCAQVVSQNYTVLVNVMRRASEEITNCLSSDKWVFDGWKYQDLGDNHPGLIEDVCRAPTNNDTFCNGRWSKPGSESLWLYSAYFNNLFYLGLQLSVGGH
jgi:hypothetical protein